jgi:hypothetical protein
MLATSFFVQGERLTFLLVQDRSTGRGKECSSGVIANKQSHFTPTTRWLRDFVRRAVRCPVSGQGKMLVHVNQTLNQASVKRSMSSASDRHCGVRASAVPAVTSTQAPVQKIVVKKVNKPSPRPGI